MSLVSRTVTTPTKQDFVDAFDDAWVFTQGRPSLLAAAILFAQFAFETGWGKFCFNWNLGNVRAAQSWMIYNDYFELPGAWEIVGGKRVVAGGCFRAFKTLAEGMNGHLHFLSALDRYRPAFDVLEEAAVMPFSKENAASFARRFVEALKAGGYFTGSVDDYVRGVSSIAQSFTALDQDTLPDTLREPASPLGSDPEFAGFGATTFADVFGRWEYDDCMAGDWLACRYDHPET